MLIQRLKHIKEQHPTNFPHVIKQDASLFAWINKTFIEIYPGTEEPLGGKIYLLTHPEEKLYCLYGNKKVYNKKGKYACKRPCQCIQDNTDATNISKYGCINPFGNKDIQKKIKNTLNEKYGVDYPMQCGEIRNKSDNTCMTRYNTTTPTKIPAVKEKSRLTNLKNRGVGYPMQAIAVRNKSKAVIFDRYGVSSICYKHMTPNNIEILLSKELFAEELKNTSVMGLAKKLNVITSTIYSYHKKYGLNIIVPSHSTQEKELSLFLNQNNIQHLMRDKTVIAPYELDFYIPSQNIAIEINGVYWHMTPKLYESADINPTNGKTAGDIWERDELKKKLCMDKNIELITIWEDEWEESKAQWKTYLLHRLLPK